MLRTFIRATIARVLGVRNPESIDPDKGFFEMGLDSLMSIDLKTRLEIGVGHSLPSTLVFNYPSISALAEYLGKDMLGHEHETESRSESTPDRAPEVVAETTADMSEEELAELLQQKLAKLSGDGRSKESVKTKGATNLHG